MAYWINTYHPLAATPEGPWSRHEPRIPPFVDASCRREPDFEATKPAITGLCRTDAVRLLRVGDIVAYFTVKRSYFADVPHRRLTALLKVLEEERSHLAADRWYERNGHPLPRNIMVPRNPPLPLEMTEGGYRDNGAIVAPQSKEQAAGVLAHWDRLYQERRCSVGDVRICEPLLVNICSGFKFGDDLVKAVFGERGFPNTQWRPARIEWPEMSRIIRLVGRDDIAEKT